MNKASDMMSQIAPTAKAMIDAEQVDTSALRNQYKAEMNNAEIMKSGPAPSWEAWLKEKGYGLANGQVTRNK